MSDQADKNRLHTLRHAAFSVDDVRAMERPLLDDGVPLMRMAATATAHITANLLDEEGLALRDSRIVVLAGAGDNGGDGLYAAAALAENGASVTAVAVGQSLHDAAFAAFVRAGGKVLVLDPASRIPGCAAGFGPGEAGERLQAAIELARHSHVIIDAMTGIGVTGPLHGIAGTIAASLGVYGTIPDRTATPDDEPTGDFPLIVAVDTPSGVGVDDGSLQGPYIPADVTAMFGAMKPCAVLPPAAYACGRVSLVDFGFDLDDAEPAVEAVSGDEAVNTIRLPRLADGKYSRGVTGVIAGSDRYPGAAVLCAKAAASSNVGMIRYMGPERERDMVLRAIPEAVFGKGRVQAWVVGSGVPSSEDSEEDIQRQTIARLLAHYALKDEGADPELAWEMPPVVVDAGALDLLPSEVPPQVIITPHAGELAHFLNDRGEDIDAEAVQLEPLHWAIRAHELSGATVLLKGAITVIVGESSNIESDEVAHNSADDDRQLRILVAGRAPAWLATAGAGDVLAGIIGALVAQQDDDDIAYVDVAAAGAYLHGYAAALAADCDLRGFDPPRIYGDETHLAMGRLGRPIVASDVIDMIPTAIQHLLS